MDSFKFNQSQDEIEKMKNGEITYIKLTPDEVKKYQKTFKVVLENKKIEKFEKRKKIFIDLTLEDHEFKYNNKIEKRVLKDDRIIKNLSTFNALDKNFFEEKEFEIKIDINNP